MNPRNLTDKELIAELQSDQPNCNRDELHDEVITRYATCLVAIEQYEQTIEDMEQEHETQCWAYQDQLDEAKAVLSDAVPWFRQWANDYADMDGEVDADQTLDNDAWRMVERIENIV